MQDWPLKSINLNQYFSPIWHPSFSFSLFQLSVFTSSHFDSYFFFISTIRFFFFCVSLSIRTSLRFPLPLSRSFSPHLSGLFFSPHSLSGLGFYLSHTRWDPFQLEYFIRSVVRISLIENLRWIHDNHVSLDLLCSLVVTKKAGIHKRIERIGYLIQTTPRVNHHKMLSQFKKSLFSHSQGVL